MEDVLETYQKPRDPDRPLVCLDETSKQLVVETRKPIPAKPGQPARPTSQSSNARSQPGRPIEAEHHAKADWQFTTADARVKLKRLYPQI